MKVEVNEPVLSDHTQGAQTIVVAPQSGFDDGVNAISDGGAELLAAEEDSTLGSNLLTGAAIGLGVLILGSLSSDLDPKAKCKGPAVRPNSRSKQGFSPKPNYPMLPQWLFEIDQIRQNTVEEKRSLSTKSWDGIKKDTDAIILLGHLVKREIAIKATGLLGHEALVYLVLRKKAFLRARTRWLSGEVNYTPVDSFDEDNAEELATKIESELSGMPLWAQFVGGIENGFLRITIDNILAHHDIQRKHARARADEARVGVSWRSRKRPRPGEAYYDAIARECGRSIYRSEEIQKAGRTALSALDTGKVVPARAFIAKHGKSQASPS